MEPKQPVNNIRAVIFDYGEVLCAAPPPDFIASMAAIVGVAPERFRQLYSRQRLAYDRGDLDAPAYWAKLSQEAGMTLSHEQVERLRQMDVAMWSNLNHDMLRWAFELRAAGVKTAVLSNMHLDMVRYTRQNFTWMADFDCLTLSSELHMAKPDAEIFRHCLQCLDVPAEHALFLDDREANIQGAEAVGIRGIVTLSPDQLRRSLQEIGFAPLPS